MGSDNTNFPMEQLLLQQTHYGRRNVERLLGECVENIQMTVRQKAQRVTRSFTTGGIKITADRLEAVYPRGSGGRPGRIEATQNVRIVQEGAQAECREAVFEERVGRIVCSAPGGNATLRRGGDVVRGDRIEFDLRKGVLKVRGRARVRIQPRKRDVELLPSAPPAPDLAPEAESATRCGW